METTRVPIKRRMDGSIVVYPFRRVVYSNENGHSNRYWTMNESQRHKIDRKKLDPRGHTLRPSLLKIKTVAVRCVFIGRKSVKNSNKIIKEYRSS